MELSCSRPAANASSDLIDHDASLEASHEMSRQDRSSCYPRRRRLQEKKSKTNSKMQIVALYQGFGSHYVDLYVGKPPQRQTLIVDTGSATTAFPCSGCSPRRCGRLDHYHADPIFQESRSNTFQKIQCYECFLGNCLQNANGDDECSFGVAYQEGSNWTAYESIDSCYIGGLHNRPLEQHDNDEDTIAASSSMDGLDPYAAPNFEFDLRFGCQTQMTGHFRTQLASGIMGLDVGRLAIWNQLYLAGKIAARGFSLCFSRAENARRSGTEAGAMTLGGTDTRLHKHGMVFSPSNNPEGDTFFSVRLRKIYLRQGMDSAIGDSNLKTIPLVASESDMNQGSVIIDSGTTDTYFVHHLAEPFQKAWKELIGSEYSNNPVKLTKEELNRLPTIILQFKGDPSNSELDNEVGLPLVRELDPNNPLDVLIAIPPSHYFEFQQDSQKYFPGVYFDEQNGSVLGANVMMYHDIFFDVENSRIGWAESDCNYTGLVASFVEGREVAVDRDKLLPHNLRHRPGSQILDKFPILSTNHKSAFSRIHPSQCSSVACRLSVGTGLFVGATVALFVALREKTLKHGRRRRRFRRRREYVPLPFESESDVSLPANSTHSPLSVQSMHVVSRGRVLRSRSSQLPSSSN